MRIIASIVVIIYLVSLSKPVQTLVYFANNQEMIAEELCENKEVVSMECNGKCYLMKEMANDVQTDPLVSSDNEEDQNNKKGKNQYKQKDYERINAPLSFDVLIVEEKEKAKFSFNLKPLQRANSIQLPPPKKVYLNS